MKQDAFRRVLADLKAAARLGRKEALDAALEALLADRHIAANRRLGVEAVQHRLLPLGAALATPTVPAEYLRGLLHAPYAAIRAVGAAALGFRYARGASGQSALRPAAGDARDEVRLALRLALQAAPAERLGRLVDAWLAAPSPRLQALALQLLPHLPLEAAVARIEALAPLGRSEHGLVERALAGALASLAQQGAAGAVLALLQAWAEQPAPPLTLIGRVLGHPWVLEYLAEAQALLDDLTRRHGRRRAITNARRAIERHRMARRA